MEQQERILTCTVDPAEYTAERLSKERLALLKCVADTPIQWSNSIGERPEIGKYYLAISSNHGNFLELKESSEDVFWAAVLDTASNRRRMILLDNFEIAADPCGVMERKRGMRWYYWNRKEWQKAKMANRDHSGDIVSEAYLREHQFALVQFVRSSSGRERYTPGKQYLALTNQSEWLNPDGYFLILSEDTEGRQTLSWEWSSDFERISDPLGLLDSWQTEWEDNVQMQIRNHPEWRSFLERSLGARQLKRFQKNASEGRDRQ